MRVMLCAALVAVLALPAAADDRKDIEALYGKLTRLILTNNAEGTLALETPDFKSKGHDGKVMNGKQLVAQMKQDSAMMKIKTFNIKLAQVSIKGNKADVQTTFTSTAEMMDPSGSGKKHAIGMNGAMSNKLAKTAGGWKFSYLEEKAGGMTLDGKPFDPSKMGGPPPPKKKGK